MKLTATVHLLAFNDDIFAREHPELPLTRTVELEVPEEWDEDSVLEEVYYHTQNDHNPQPCRSSSVGDIVQIGELFYIIKGIGFKSLSAEAVVFYRTLSKYDRDIFTRGI
jgi:hypothetical protein